MLILKRILLIGIILTMIFSSPVAQTVQNTVGVTSNFGNGTVRIDTWKCYTMETAPPIGKTCPMRVEFAADVLDNVLICRSHETGQNCKSLGAIFPKIPK